VLVDCHELKRLGPLASAAMKLETRRLVIDHHIGADQGDGHVTIVDVQAPATGALVYDLTRKMGAPLSPAAAEGLFLALVTDTGWFRYSNTDDQALAIAADLIACGVQAGELYDRLHRQKPPESITLLSQALARVRLEAGGQIALVPLDRDYMALVERTSFDTDEVLDPVRSVQGVELVAMFKATPRGSVKLSLRSRSRHGVDGVARELGGGGHRLAAGAEIRGPLSEVVETVLAKLRQLLPS
jgi:phosphoesterase RecJ-like protein